MAIEWTQDPPEHRCGYEYWWPTIEEHPGVVMWKRSTPQGMRSPFRGDWTAATKAGMVRSLAYEEMSEGAEWPENHYFEFSQHAEGCFPRGALPKSVRRTVRSLTGKDPA